MSAVQEVAKCALLICRDWYLALDLLAFSNILDEPAAS